MAHIWNHEPQGGSHGNVENFNSFQEWMNEMNEWMNEKWNEWKYKYIERAQKPISVGLIYRA